jgi:hypothetical protein
MSPRLQAFNDCGKIVLLFGSPRKPVHGFVESRNDFRRRRLPRQANGLELFTLVVLPLEKAVGGQYHQITRMKLHPYRRIGVERIENAEGSAWRSVLGNDPLLENMALARNAH